MPKQTIAMDDISNLLLKAANTLTLSLDLQKVLETLADIVLEVTGRSRILILMLDKFSEHPGELNVVVSRGKQATPVGTKLNLKQLLPPVQKSIYEKKATVSDYESADMPEHQRQLAWSVNAKLLLAVPLIVGNEATGYIAIDEPGEKRAFSRRDIEIVEGIASQASVAIENSRLHSQTKEELSYTKLLQEIAMAATTQPNLQDIARKILEALNKHLKLHAGDIKVLTHDKHFLKLMASFGYPEATVERIRQLPVEHSGFLTTESVRKRLTLTHNEEVISQERLRTLEEAGLENTRYLVTPIKYRDEVVGTFGLVFRGKRDFAKAELDTFQAVAQTIGQSIENARLFEAEKKRTKELVVHRKNLAKIVKERTKELYAANLRFRRSEEQHRQLIEVSPDAYFVFADNRILYANPAALELFGYREVKEIDSTILQNSITPEKYSEIKDYLTKNHEFRKPVNLGELTIVREGLQPLIVDVTVIPVIFEGKEGHQYIVRDVTHRKEMEKEMARLGRLNLVGEMAAGIGHEVRNPMTTVRGFLQLLGNRPECQGLSEYFTLMIDELDRANSIITEFLSMAKNKSVNLKKSNLNNIVEVLVPLIRADAMVTDKNVSLELGEIPDTNLDEKEIRQLILNLVRNGLEAVPCNEVIAIKTYLEGNKVVMAVSDRGSGISPEVLEKLGTPFFTTKAEGTGLGLAVCYSIAARHNAKIEVVTGVDGTTFRVCFIIQ